MSTRSCPVCSSQLPHDAAYCAQCGSATHTQIIGEAETVGVGVGVSASYVSEPARLQKALGPNLELGRLIGRGGYAEVFQVHDRKLDRDLAIKVIRPDLIVTPALLARFRREAMAVAALRHPGIVPVYDVGETDGICYIVMPLIEGESLKAVAQRQRRLPVDEVQRIVLEAAKALAAAHAANVVHRDIKPENIMLEGVDRHVRLMDFGIAKAVDSSDKELTGTGVVVGTPAYMSPEQASGEPTIDHRSDQYSLAVVAYQLLAGRAPFEGETARSIIAKQLLDQPAPLDTLVDNVPPHIVAALQRAMQKSPKQRFESIRDFAAALQDSSYQNPPGVIASTEPVVAAPRNAWLPWIGGALAVVTIAAVAMSQLRQPATVASAPLGPANPSPVAPDTQPPAAATTSVAPPPPPPPAVIPIKVDTVRDTIVRLAAPADTASPAPAPVVTCAQLVDRQSWEDALARCGDEARAGNVRAAKVAAQILIEGRPSIPPDQPKAAVFYELAAKAGDPEAQVWIGRRSEATEPSRASELYLSAARSGYGRAYPLIATRLEQGLGTAVDPVGAAYWYEKAAETGDVASQLKLATLYLAGRGVKRSDASAEGWLKRAADQGNHDAQYQLGMLYLKGSREVKKSESEGVRLLRLAAAAGHPDAKSELDRRKE